jgi:hypothetical protein
MEDITLKEWLLAIAVFIASLALAVYINPFIMNKMLDNVQTVSKALQIRNDPVQFQYVQKTEVGDVLAYGEMSALNPVGLPELLNTFSIIVKTHEHYTMHTREVCTTDSNGDESCSPETYYEWDSVGSDISASGSYSFLNVIFSESQLSLNPVYILSLDENSVTQSNLDFLNGNYLYTESFWGRGAGDDRYYYKVLPLTFNLSILVKFREGLVTNPLNNSKILACYYEKDPGKVIQEMKSNITMFNVIYYILFSGILVGAFLWWAYSNNNELEEETAPSYNSKPFSNRRKKVSEYGMSFRSR